MGKFIQDDFLKRLDADLLSQYLSSRDITNKIDPDGGIEPNLKSFHEAYDALTFRERESIEGELAEIDSMSSGDGFLQLQKNSQDKGVEIDLELLDKKSLQYKSLWFFLNHKEIFLEALVWTEVERKSGWHDMDLSNVDNLQLDKECLTNLESELGEYIRRTQARAFQTTLEDYSRDHKKCVVLYAGDYATNEVEFENENNLSKRNVRRPVFKTYFLFNLKDQRFRFKSNAIRNKDDRSQLIEIFQRNVWGDADLGIREHVLKLDEILKNDFRFSHMVDEGVKQVRIKSVQLENSLQDGYSDRVTLDLINCKDSNLALLDAMKSYNLDTQKWSIVRLKLSIYFESKVKFQKTQVTFDLSLPNRCTLSDNEIDNKARRLLRIWGLDVNKNGDDI